MLRKKLTSLIIGFITLCITFGGGYFLSKKHITESFKVNEVIVDTGKYDVYETKRFKPELERRGVELLAEGTYREWRRIEHEGTFWARWIPKELDLDIVVKAQYTYDRKDVEVPLELSDGTIKIIIDDDKLKLSEPFLDIKNSKAESVTDHMIYRIYTPEETMEIMRSIMDDVYETTIKTDEDFKKLALEEITNKLKKEAELYGFTNISVEII